MISFLQPLALVGLVAAGIPALLHLLGRRMPPFVVFPAVRYLTATEREHSRKLRFRNLLLLILRTIALVFLILAAARPVADVGSGTAHPPTGVALVVDNSLSSGVVIEGKPMLDTIAVTALGVIERLQPGDRLWLVLSDGIPRRRTRIEAEEIVGGLEPSLGRLDLGAAVRSAARAVHDDALADGQVVVVSDLQATAISEGPDPVTRVLLWSPPEAPENRWLDSVYVDPRVWVPNGAVVASVEGTSDAQAALRLRITEMELARALVSPGDRVVLTATLPRPGWSVGSVELDPDELRADDRRMVALFRAEPAAVTVHAEVGRYVEEALTVLREGGRVVRGETVHVGELSQYGTAVLFPPSDPALVGDFNRTLAARGFALRLEELLVGEWSISGDLSAANGIAVFRRFRLLGGDIVYATAGGDPWVVREGNVVLIASRMEPEWTGLPISAAFVPVLDRLVNGIAAKESWTVLACSGDMVELPASAAAVLASDGGDLIAVQGDRLVAVPQQPGVYFLRGISRDTVGALEVNVDPRESRLRAADSRQLRAAFGGTARALETSDLYREIFRGSERASLTGFCLLAALIAVLGEFFVSSLGGQTREKA